MNLFASDRFERVKTALGTRVQTAARGGQARFWTRFQNSNKPHSMQLQLFRNSRGMFSVVAGLLFAAVTILNADSPRPVRVLVWDEQQPEQKRAYSDKFLGETIAAHLAAQPGFMVKSVSLASPSQGLDEATLNDADVVIWWSHQKNHLVADENVERLVTRVREGKLGFIPLHSAHWSKPFVRLMQERTKDDARAQLPAAERATAKFEYSNQNPYGKVPKRDAPLTPSLRLEDGVWKLTLPGCIFPAYRGDGAPSHVTTLLPSHPIAAGLPLKWDVKQTEMYDEPFHVPKPDAVVFEERWDKGEHFRSGCVWQVGQGRVFYFRPGHETYPVFKQAEPLRVLENAARWLAQEK
jgi:trehalose utilization protein